MALFLAVFQCVVALVGGLLAHLVTNVARWRRLRGRAIRAGVFAAMGSSIGGLAGYAIVALGIAHGFAAPLLAAAYLVGLAWGGFQGWRRGDLAPDFESNPISSTRR